MTSHAMVSLACAAALFCLSTAQAQTFAAHGPVDAETALDHAGDVAASCQISGQFLDGAHILQDLYAPFAMYTMTPEQQAVYLAMIHAIWQGPYWDTDPEEINDDMAQVVNIVLWEIARCANKLGFLGPKMEYINQNFGSLGPESMWDYVETDQAEILVELAWIRISWIQRGWFSP